MAQPMRVGVTATKAPWGLGFRRFVRDHAAGVLIEPLLDASQLPGPGERALDALIVDDQARILTAAQIGAVQVQGTHVIGLWDESAGRGRDYLMDLGVSELLPVEITPAELVAALLRVGPVNAGSGPADDDTAGPTAGLRRPDPQRGPTVQATARRGSPRATRRPKTTVFAALTGGTGCTETIIGVAERLSKMGTRVLVVEAAGTILARRLRRAPEYGLSWSLERLRQGQRALPEGLSPGRDDGTRPLGDFDVVCGTSTTWGPPTINPVHFAALLDEAAVYYEDILIDIGPLAAPPKTGADRNAAGGVALARGDQMVIFAAPDPCGATKLVEWQAAVHHLELTARTCAVFGRAPARPFERRYERSQLADTVESNTAQPGYASIHFLPEDRAVARARWNFELVVTGRWFDAVAALVAELSGFVPQQQLPPTVSGRGRRPRRQPQGATR